VGFVPPSVPRSGSATIAFIGQGPGEIEAMYSIPFHPEAPAGKMLTEWIHLAGLQRTEVLITNGVWCWLPAAKPNGVPKGNRDPTRDEQDHCYRQHLHPLLTKLGFDQPDKWVFTVGASVSKYLLELDGSSEKHLGTVTVKELPHVPEPPPF
jgi:uracil-DNA glycosylase family 4